MFDRELLTIRTANLALMLLLTGASLIALVVAFFTENVGASTAGGALGTLIFGALTVAYWYGRSEAAPATVAMLTLVTAAGILVDPSASTEFSPSFLVPPVVALLMSNPLFIALSGGIMLATVSLGLGVVDNPYLNPIRLILTILILVILVLSRLVLDAMLQRTEHQAAAAEAAREHADQEAAIARTRAEELARTTEEQQRLLDLVAVLETPAVNLAHGVLLAPIVGTLDSRRAQRLMGSLLDSVSRQRARLLVIDLAGVSTVDTAVAQALMRTVQAVQLLGCAVTVTGISAEAAVTLTTLGITWPVQTARTPQEALALYEQNGGGKIAANS